MLALGAADWLIIVFVSKEKICFFYKHTVKRIIMPRFSLNSFTTFESKLNRKFKYIKLTFRVKGG